MSKPGTNTVDFEVKDGVAIVTLDHFPVNTLTNAVQLGIESAAEKISNLLKQGTGEVKAVVVRGAGGRAFCAGADIQDLNKKHERLPKRPFMEYFEELEVPVVALLQGFTLGGGFELALGCHYRVIAPEGVIGLPEVNIGLLPGGQGTQRLPRLVGVKPALDIMLSGDHVPAKLAMQLAVVDAILPKGKDYLEEAKAFALSKVGKDLKSRRTSLLKAPIAEDNVFQRARSEMGAKRRGQVAPEAIIKCVEAACSKDFRGGVTVEQEEFLKVLISKEARALQHIFFAERESGKFKSRKPSLPISKVAVIGSGVMGSGIAMNFVNIGIPVVLVDRSQEFLDRAKKVIGGNYDRSVERKSKTQAQVDKAMDLITYITTDRMDRLKDVDLVIEAVFEDLEVKKDLFKKLVKVTKHNCILASNTSYLNIDAMAEAAGQADMTRVPYVVGMHFFSPANVMKLLENIRGRKTSEQVLKTVMDIGTKIGKWPVLVRNRYGFVGNRMLKYYSTEAINMVLEGVPFEKVDDIAVKFGMPMGPFMMQDLTGLDIGYQARKKSGDVDEDKNIVDALIAAGRLGMKNGKGWYEYNGRNRHKSDVAQEIIAKVISANGMVVKRTISDKEIEERLFYPIVNEGFKVLEEKVADKPGDIDTVYVHGYNWPRVTGGPMFYADQIGVKNVLATLEKYSKDYPRAAYFQPSKLLKDCVGNELSLQDFWRKNSGGYKFQDDGARL